ncbi:MAG: hypothetical protein ABIH11_09165 [Candidatus Altiarchaeota archaeon]
MYLKRLILAIAVLSMLASVASAVRLKELTIDKDPIEYGKKFTLTAEISGEAVGVNAKFYIDEINYGPKVGKIDEDKIEGEWVLDNWDRYTLKCGPHKARVELFTSSGELIDNESMGVDIGNVPKILFEPAAPLVNKDVRITLIDKKSNSQIPTVDVEVRHPQMDTISTRAFNGVLKFKPDNTGKHTLHIDDSEYCGDLEFYAKKEMIVDGPRPESPVVGEMVVIAFPANSDIGTKIFDSGGKVYAVVRGNTIAGYANFTISEPGEYILTLGDISTRYWGVNKTLIVRDKADIAIAISPETPALGLPVTISLNAGGSPLSDARVIITSPDGVSKEFTSMSDGRVTYGEGMMIGDYEVEVQKEKYATSHGGFTILNSFKVNVEPETPTVVAVTKIIVLDQNNKLVSDAVVRVLGTSLRKMTDPEGKVEFLLNDSREYVLEVAKEGYWNTSVTVKPCGFLNIQLDKYEVEVGDDVTASVTACPDGQVAADIKIIDPDDISTISTTQEKKFKAEKPGEYKIEVSKPNYISNNTLLKVSPHPLSISSSVSENERLLVKVSSRDKPVTGINVTVVSKTRTQNSVTNNQGVASFDIEGEGIVTVTANTGGNRNYESITRKEDVARSYRILLLVVPVFVIITVSVVLIAGIQLWKHYKGGPPAVDGKKPRKKHGKHRKTGSSRMFDESGGSRLGGV